MISYILLRMSSGWGKTHLLTMQRLGGGRLLVHTTLVIQESSLPEPSLSPDLQLPIGISFPPIESYKRCENCKQCLRSFSGSDPQGKDDRSTAEGWWLGISHAQPPAERPLSHSSLEEKVQSTPPYEGRFRQGFHSRSLKVPVKQLEPILFRAASVY